MILQKHAFFNLSILYLLTGILLINACSTEVAEKDAKSEVALPPSLAIEKARRRPANHQTIGRTGCQFEYSNGYRREESTFLSGYCTGHRFSGAGSDFNSQRPDKRAGCGALRP